MYITFFAKVFNEFVYLQLGENLNYYLSKTFNITHKSYSKSLWHFLFWGVLFLYYLNVSWLYEENKIFLLERVLFKISLQILFAYIMLLILFPYVLYKGHKVLIVSISLLLSYVYYVIFVAIRCFYLLPKYPEVYSYRPPLIFDERLLDFYAFLGNIPDFIFPIVILILIDYYKKEKEVANLLEKQRTAELNALKSQLNPHFLFNTLNNLYALALKKSDKTPDIIAKLADILDYILYQCKSQVVPLKNEIQLLQNYIDLEKVRYGNRVMVDFSHQVESNIKIMPLMLLTFVENAYKHGVRQEIGTARITIFVKSQNNQVIFSVENSKPKIPFAHPQKDYETIGLKNVKRQLDILYKNNYKLTINDAAELYTITLKINTNAL